ncbi:endonuclease domain-containing protein [Cellulomonas wangsupingiae]|uniref:Endonuclease domain-containing protein n=1 Tax=Cellulomonas wangsupingiae TaxID=2968085 RepID=A0ABY5K8I9_9CELL|nr:endonuclease domain-containing protein [Cellulomonas wangsupingiae]MCC2336310.1 endonuclease domain-containing protein [Cellulomonas wangsupingiae]UUI65711.1 endonuclease domain-containing protein [Cellulomonas wangsupingiae]
MRPTAPLPDHLLRTAQVQDGLLDSGQCDAAGVGSARRAALRRAGMLLPVVRGVHDAAPALAVAAGGGPEVWAGVHPADHARRRAAWLAVLALDRTRAVAVGACALALLGVQGLPARIRPEAALPDGTHRAPGGDVRVRCLDVGLDLGAVQQVGALHVAGPVDALAQAVCELDREHAVAVLDSAVQRRLLAPEQLDDVRRRAHGRRGSRRAAGWWDLVDGRAQSPLETRARLQCRDAGVAPHDLQVPVRDGRGRVVALGDLGWRLEDGRLLVVEIDGAGPHTTPEAVFRDRQRQNAVVATGTLLLRFTAADVRAGRVAATVARYVPRSTMRDPPPARPG